MPAPCDIWSTARSGGCAAKLSPLLLRDLVRSIAPQGHPDLLVGFETMDDAAVYRLTDDLALVQTVDFVTPVVDDPYLYGQVAAANALADVWAMGGRPLTAMNVCCFPDDENAGEPLARILAGGLSKIEEAGAVLVGGHTVRDEQAKYGLAVTGLVHPDRITRNSGTRPGDALILTKPLGSGVHVTAARRGLVSTETLRDVFRKLAALDGPACETMLGFGVRGATDVTGFGIGGHALGMARASGVTIRLFLERLPVFADTFALLRSGVVTSATRHNMALVAPEARCDPAISPAERRLVADPQTAGGLLIAIRAEDAEALASALVARGAADATIVGEVLPPGRFRIEFVRG